MGKRGKFLLLLMGMGIILIGFKIIRGGLDTGSPENRELDIIKEIEIDHRGELFCEKVKSHLIQYQGGILSSYNKKGEKNWTSHLGVLNPTIKCSPKAIYVLDNDRNQIISIDRGGEIIYRYNVGDRLEDFQACKDNYLLLQYPYKNKTSQLKVLDNEGREYSEFSLTEGRVVNISISKADNFIGINTLTMKGDIESRFLIYDMEGQLKGTKNLDDQLILGFQQDGKGNTIVVGERQVFAINKNNEVKWDMGLAPIKLFKGKPTKHMIFYSGDMDNKQWVYRNNPEEIRIIQYNGKEVARTGLDEGITGMDLGEDAIALYSSRTIFLLDSGGKLNLKHQYSSDIEKIFVFSKRELGVVTRDKISFIKIRDG